jgi:hypothetical protein
VVVVVVVLDSMAVVVALPVQIPLIYQLRLHRVAQEHLLLVVLGEPVPLPIPVQLQ